MIHSIQHAFAAVLVVGTALVPNGLLPGSRDARAHEQVNQLLRVINRLGRLKAAERALLAAERNRRAQVFCSARQPSELRFATVKPLFARAHDA